jgi:hypothetical protein
VTEPQSGAENVGEPVKTLDWPMLNEAITLWIGHHETGYPTHFDDRLVRHYGRERGATILTKLRELESEFYQSDAYLRAGSLAEMDDLAVADFRGRYPEVSVKAAEKFALLYTFDYR